jgi:hypothetical protein
MNLLEDRTAFQLALSFVVPAAWALVLARRLLRRAKDGGVARWLVVPVPVVTIVLGTWALLVVCGPYLPEDRPPEYGVALLAGVAWFLLTNLLTASRLETPYQRKIRRLRTSSRVRTGDEALALVVREEQLRQEHKASLRSQAPSSPRLARELHALVRDEVAGLERMMDEARAGRAPGLTTADIEPDLQKRRAELRECELWLPPPPGQRRKPPGRAGD